MKAYEFPAQRLAHAKAYRNTLWRIRTNKREDARIAELVSWCTAVCEGDPKAGAALAVEAIWS
jgi:hypothetical protein